ncbi:MAG: leucine-rich repeat domain-containing protein, partial [Clostridia bacterium]|nr:leucine-rich repeat domain-containing protein [Clostridia bacterium]
MKKISKIISVILSILMIISIIPITASAEELITSGTYGDNVTWTFDESTGTLTFSGTGAMQHATSHGVPWNGHIDSIESVIISEGVTTIGDKVFYNHKNIKNVSIADSVTAIDDEAFFNCTGLTDVVIGKGVTMIGEFAFEDCSNLKTVTIYNAVEEICRYAFNGCSKLTDVYYFGTEAEWNAITKATLLSKTGLENATIHFLGEETHECSYNAVVTPPTCTEQGYTTYTCECGDSYVDDYVNATGHNYNAVVTAPTCTEEGYTTHTCTACGRKYKDDYTPNNGHKYNMAESKVKEATCTEGGYRYVQCLNCDFIFYYNIVDAKGHWYEDQTVILPTCTEPGYIYSVCECGEYFEDYVDALGHTEEKIPAVAPTCTETGLTAGTKCSVCGETVKEQETVPAKGHKYTPVTTIPATHTTTGIMTYICNCGDRYTKVIEKLDAHHNYKSVITAPTCTEQGYTTYTCSCGDTYIRDYVDATGHNYNAV